MTEDSLASSPRLSGPEHHSSLNSLQSVQRPLPVREDEKENSDQKHVERHRANTVTELHGQTSRPAHPARYYSDQQQPRLPGPPSQASPLDGMTVEQNPFMLKMSNPLPFTSTQPSSPTKYIQPESGGARPRFNSSPLIGTNSNPTSPRLPAFAESSDDMKTPTSASSSRPTTRVSVSTSSLLPSPPIGSTPPLGDRTFSERTESSLATPLSEEMSTVPPPTDTTNHHITRSAQGLPTGGRPAFLSADSDGTSAESPSVENVPIFHRGVPQLTTGLLQHTRCTIPSSRVMPNAAGKEVLCFIVKVMLRPPGSQQVLSWNVSKMLSAFANLDNKIRTLLGSKKEIKQAGVANLPESKTWKDFAPSKIDQRKVSAATLPIPK
jgi:RalA-binding protein 1